MVYYILWMSSFLSTAFIPYKILRNYSIICLTCIFWLMITLRGNGVDADYEQYLSYISDIELYDSLSRGGMVFDSIAKFVLYAGLPVTAIFFIYGLAVPIKTYLFLKFPDYGYAIFLGYVGFFVYLHDFTQIRAGLAIALGYWAIYLKYNGGVLSWIVLALLAVFVHPSLLLVISFVLVSSYVSIRMLIATLLASVIICYFDILTPVIDRVVHLIGNADLTLYYNLAVAGQNMKPFGIFPVICIFLTLSICYYLPRLYKNDKLTVVFIKMLLISQISWFFFYSIPVFAGRINQLFLFSILFLLPLLSKITLRNYIIIPAIFSCLGLAAFIYAGGLMNDYRFL